MAWVEKTYGIEIDQDEPPDDWDSMAAEYDAMLDAQAEEAEAQWLERHSHNQFFREFSEELATASSLLGLEGGPSQVSMAHKLVYAHAVTLLETLINSVVRKLVTSEQSLMMKLAARHESLNKRTLTLKEIAEKPKVVETLVLNVLSEMSFHNVATIKGVLDAMFGEHMKGLELGHIARICKKRHDIVHRNGRTIEDELIELSIPEVRIAISTINDFAADLKRRIYEALAEQEHDGF
ncbi:hypothetical protein F7R15_19635 [Pseudomonas reinekei]|uniref:RiboL-PSP-HEPN domain-containing protein n=1 Tax=Pseudomonas reinekei TaxID=395598 RepID=A0A6H9RJR9_PSERE|nr:hypothetical protein F7R15_19635 [Pseudomonas reinekei]